jgi:hypothetical protein
VDDYLFEVLAGCFFEGNILSRDLVNKGRPLALCMQRMLFFEIMIEY